MEDEAIIAADLSEHLATLGLDVVGWVCSGEEAIRAARSLSPDLVVMDIRLQGAIDGVEAARRIQDRHSGAIIFVTAHQDPAILRRAERSGVRRFVRLLKPFQVEDVRTAVDSVLSDRGSARGESQR